MKKGRSNALALTGTHVRYVGEEAYTRQDDSEGRLWRWAITCASCGEWFEFVQGTSHALTNLGPELDLGRLMRRCEDCRPKRLRRSSTAVAP